MNDSLLEAMRNWLTPESVNNVQKFLGLTAYYRKLAKHYAHTARPISDLVRKRRFEGETEQTSAFIHLKQALLTAFVLATPRMDEKFLVSSDALNYAVDATLELRWHPVAHLSHRL